MSTLKAITFIKTVYFSGDIHDDEHLGWDEVRKAGWLPQDAIQEKIFSKIDTGSELSSNLFLSNKFPYIKVGSNDLILLSRPWFKKERAWLGTELACPVDKVAMFK